MNQEKIDLISNYDFEETLKELLGSPTNIQEIMVPHVYTWKVDKVGYFKVYISNTDDHSHYEYVLLDHKYYGDDTNQEILGKAFMFKICCDSIKS